MFFLREFVKLKNKTSNLKMTCKIKGFVLFFLREFVKLKNKTSNLKMNRIKHLPSNKLINSTQNCVYGRSNEVIKIWPSGSEGNDLYFPRECFYNLVCLGPNFSSHWRHSWTTGDNSFTNFTINVKSFEIISWIYLSFIWFIGMKAEKILFIK